SAHGSGQYLHLRWKVYECRQLLRTTVERVADLERVAAPSEQQGELVSRLRKLGHDPARVFVRDYGTEPHPSLEVLDAGLDPVALVDSHHRTRLVVLRGVGATQSHREVELAGGHVTVEVSGVAVVSVTCGSPEICASIRGNTQHVKLLGPTRRFIQPMHGALLVACWHAVHLDDRL